MSSVNKLKAEEDMDMDEAIRAGVSMRKQLLHRLVDVPPKGFYDESEDEEVN